MNKNIFAFALMTGLAWVFLAGCESDRAKPPGIPVPGMARPLVEERPLSVAEILARAAAQLPAPVAGAGWQALFNAKRWPAGA